MRGNCYRLALLPVPGWLKGLSAVPGECSPRRPRGTAPPQPRSACKIGARSLICRPNDRQRYDLP
jgi:hypothetical protein